MMIEMGREQNRKLVSPLALEIQIVSYLAQGRNLLLRTRLLYAFNLGFDSFTNVPFPVSVGYSSGG